MTKTWRQFKKDRYFFLKYFFLQMLTSLALFAVLYHVKSPWTETFHLGGLRLLLVPLSVALGVMVPALLHNAVHGNLPRPWMNEVFGEFCGFFVLFGLGPFRISHFLHHAFADSERDPHPPNGKGFVYFLATTQMNTIKVIRKAFLDQHGDTRAMHAVLFVEMAFYYVSLAARIAGWVWLLGPSFFLLAYAPAYLTNVLVFAHINFATHRTNPDGSVEIINLNETAYHRLVNAVGSGVYFHKNHHIKPSLYNPSKLATSLQAVTKVTQVTSIPLDSGRRVAGGSVI